MMALCAPIDLNYSKLNYTAMKHFNLLKTTLLLCALIVGSLSSWAADETIVFSDLGYTNATEISNVSGSKFSVTFNKGTNNNTPKYYN